jgi:hypothetical protein
MSVYDRYPAIDQSYNFPPDVREALAYSIELAQAIQQSMPPILNQMLADDPTIRAALVSKIATLVSGDLNLIHKNDPGIGTVSSYDDYDWLILDPSNHFALGIANDGTTRAERFSTGKLTLGDRLTQYILEDGEYAWFVADAAGHISELRLNMSGKVPDDVLQSWASRMNWSDDDIEEILAEALIDYQPGLEVGSAEITTDYTTAATTPGTMIPGLLLSITGGGRPVDLEFSAPNVFHTTINTDVNASIYLNGTEIQGNAVFSPKNTKGPRLTVKQRVVLEQDEDYAVTVDLWGGTAGTSKLDLALTKPAYLTGTNR